MGTNRSATTRKRKPLGDCTNTDPVSPGVFYQSINPVKPQDPSLFSVFERIVKATATGGKGADTKATKTVGEGADSTSRTGRSGVRAKKSLSLHTPASVSKSFQLQNLTPTGSSAGLESSVPRTVYKRRQTTEKETRRKSIPKLSDTVLAQKSSSSESIQKSAKYATTSRPSKVTRKKKQSRTKVERDDGSSQATTQDFIDRQRAYFAEIDTFKLSEEEVTSGDEL